MKKLLLSKETLRRLTEHHARLVAGAQVDVPAEYGLIKQASNRDTCNATCAPGCSIQPPGA